MSRQVLNGQCSSQQICYVIPYSMRVQALGEAAKVLAWEPQAGSSTSGLHNPHPGKAPVQVVLPSLSTSLPGPGTQKHSCGDLPVTGHLPDRPSAGSQQGALLEPPLAVTVLCHTPRRTARQGSPRDEGKHPLFGFELRAPHCAWQPGSGSKEAVYSHLPCGRASSPTGADTHGWGPLRVCPHSQPSSPAWHRAVLVH